MSAEDNRVISVGFSGFPDSINRKAVQTIRDTNTQIAHDNTNGGDPNSK